jgi:hypothetical protein
MVALASDDACRPQHAIVLDRLNHGTRPYNFLLCPLVDATVARTRGVLQRTSIVVDNSISSARKRIADGNLAKT